MFSGEWAKTIKAVTSSAYEVQQECMLSHGFFLLFLKLLQFCQSLSPCSFPCHSSHFTLYPLYVLLPISLLQLSLPFLFFCLHMPKIQIKFKNTINYTSNLYPRPTHKPVYLGDCKWGREKNLKAYQ